MLRRANCARGIAAGSFPHADEIERIACADGVHTARKGSGDALSSRQMFGSRPPLPWLLVPMAGVAGLPGAPAYSQEAQADRQITFDIPAQSLDGALAQYFRSSGVQLLYDSSLTAGRRSTAVRGRYARREALRRLLTGTGLIVRYSRDNAAIITMPSAATSDGPLIPLGRVVVRERIAPARVAPVERLAYYQQLEMALQSRLHDDRRTGRSAFTVVVAFHVGDDGRLGDVRIVRGSGDRRVDLAIIDALRDAIVPPPPDLLAQPLRVALRGIRR